jgi:acyl dehydratase
MAVEPTRIYFDDIALNSTFVSARRTVTETDIMNFCGLSGDFNPLHVDQIFAEMDTPFGRRIAHGLLSLAIGTGLRTEMDKWYTLAFLECQRRFVLPVFPGDTIHVRYEVVGKRLTRSHPDRGVVTLTVELLNQDEAMAQVGQDVVLIGTRGAGDG